MSGTNYISILLVLFSLFSTQLIGQRLSDWSMNDAMFFTVNPAFVARAPSLELGLTHGRRWRKLKSSPTQSDLGLIIPFPKERMGLGLHLFTEEAGPFKSNGLAVSYAYQMPLTKEGEDRLSLGTSIRLMHIAFDQDHLLAAESGDPLLGGIDGNRFVPPALSVGFHYQTGIPQYGNPVQFVIAASMAKFLPFQDRFNTLSFDRSLQWYGLFGLEIAASQSVLITPNILVSQIGGEVTNYALRIKAAYQQLGWVMTQYSKAGFLTTQLGINVGAGFAIDDVVEVSGSNSWNFSSLEGQLGNSLTFAITYRKAILR